jgi:hypothetical protein
MNSCLEVILYYEYTPGGMDMEEWAAGVATRFLCMKKKISLK